MKLATWHTIVILIALIFLVGTTLYYFVPLLQTFIFSDTLQSTSQQTAHVAQSYSLVWPSRLLS